MKHNRFYPLRRKSTEAAPSKKFKPKQDWNNYLTDNQHSLTREEVLKRKMLFVSKNNILSDAYSPPPPTLKPKKRATKAARAEVAEKSALDLLEMSELSSGDEEESVHERSGKILQNKKPVASKTSALKRAKSSAPTTPVTTIPSSPRSFVSPKVIAKSAHRVKPFKSSDAPVDEDMKEIALEISALLGELRNYEEIVGKSPSFSSQVCYSSCRLKFALFS